MNHCIFIGRLTRDPEVRTTNAGAVATFSIAVDRKFKNADGTRTADFISCVAWKHHAELVGQYFHKGNRICVTGSMQSRSYVAKDGTNKSVMELIISEIEFVESAASRQNSTITETPPTAPEVKIEPNSYIAETEPNEDVDLPFEV